MNAARMRANIDITGGLLFADAAAARLGPALGRDGAHRLVEHAAGEVRRSGDTLLAVLTRDPAVRDTGLDLAPAFDLAPAIAAAGPWVDRAVAEAQAVRQSLAGR